MGSEQEALRLLLFDIGNTSIKVGVADAAQVQQTYTLRTDAGQTADSLGLTLLTLLQHAGITPQSLTACVVSSVVPTMTPLLREACARFMQCELLQVPDTIPVPLKNHYRHPAEVGADRLVGAYAARQLCPQAPSLIVVDFGTATTFDCVSGQAYLGGLIFPGVHTAAKALSLNAAKLPRVNLEVRESEPMPGRDTASSIQHGIVFGYACMVEGLTARLAKQMTGPVRVLATGGFAKDLDKITNCFDQVLPDLLLDGLHRLYMAWRQEQGR